MFSVRGLEWLLRLGGDDNRSGRLGFKGREQAVNDEGKQEGGPGEPAKPALGKGLGRLARGRVGERLSMGSVHGLSIVTA